MKSITTKYLGPTNHKGTRVVAKSQAKRIVVSWDHALNAVTNHTIAAARLAEQMGWDGTWVGGVLPNGEGYAFVPLETPYDFVVHKGNETDK